MGTRRYGISLRVFNTRTERFSISTNNHAGLFCLSYKHADSDVSVRRFPVTFRRFVKIFQNFTEKGTQDYVTNSHNFKKLN